MGPCLDGLLLRLPGFSLYVTFSIEELDPCLVVVGLADKETGSYRVMRQWERSGNNKFLVF